MTAIVSPSSATIAALEADAIETVLGTVVNPAGLTHAKAVPVQRSAVFADPGLGASPTWHVFAIDQTGIAFTADLGVIGDQRIRIDPTALRTLGDGLAWAPGEFFDQAGAPVPVCSRGTLARVVDGLDRAGVAATIGHEIEFILVGPDGQRLPSVSWAQYGVAGLLEHECFVSDAMADATAAGVAVEQLHPEYGANQFELSLAPLPPVAAADQLVATRIILGRTARRHGMRVSFSPVPFAGSVGSGAHQHLSLHRSGVPVFSGGDGIRGMTEDGEHAVAGVLAGLPEAQGVLCGSVVSGLRMRPGNWAGAYACWGSENREAAVRFVAGGRGNPQGANIEVKVIDPSSNPYLASAAVLGLALEGMEARTPLPPETLVDPAQQSDAERAQAGTLLLPTGQQKIVDALAASDRMRRILSGATVDAVVAVRRHEYENYAALDPVELTDKFRMAWSL